jgi:hypothetical protein
MIPQIGTMKYSPKSNVSVIDQKVKDSQMNRFLSDAAISMIANSNNEVNPQTFIVRKNVKEAPELYPVVGAPSTNSSIDLDSSLSGTSRARERRRQQRTEKTKSQIDEGDSFIELLHTTIKEKPIPEVIREEKPSVLAGDQTMAR